MLPQSEGTLAGLNRLGRLMADPGDIGTPHTAFNSAIPAIFTYFGQFIDHDIIARTDRDGSLSILGRGEPVTPLDPDEIVGTLRNGRRPQLDLDSVFGEGPGLAGSVVTANTQSDVLYAPDLSLDVFNSGGRVDLPRDQPAA